MWQVRNIPLHFHDAAIPLFDYIDSSNCCIGLPWHQIIPTAASRRGCFASTFLEARDGKAGMMRLSQRGRDNGAGAMGTGQGGWDKKARTVGPGRKGKHDKASTTRPGRQGIGRQGPGWQGPGRQGPGRQGPGRRGQDGDAKTARLGRQGSVDEGGPMRWKTRWQWRRRALEQGEFMLLLPAC